MAVRLSPGALAGDVLPAVEDAITAYLDPATWDLDEDAGGRWRPPTADADRTLRAYDVAFVAREVDGVAGVIDVTINGSASVELAGYAPLPRLASVQVVAP